MLKNFRGEGGPNKHFKKIKNLTSGDRTFFWHSRVPVRAQVLLLILRINHVVSLLPAQTESAAGCKKYRKKCSRSGFLCETMELAVHTIGLNFVI